MKWKIVNNLKIKERDLSTSLEMTMGKILNILLENRGMKTKKEIENYLNPKIEDITIDSVEIDKKKLQKSLKRIKKAIESKEKIIIYGDYDVDGITGTAILWETLFGLGANVEPYIPHRVEEGYGLSIKGIENLINKNEKEKIGLIITVDNGIVAHEAVEFSNKNGIDVIITDHHTPPAGGGEKLPPSFSTVHTTKLCGAGVAYLLAQEITKVLSVKGKEKSEDPSKFLDLVTLGTIADLVPLKDANRAIVKIGLEYLRDTKRVGLQMLYKEAGIDPKKIGIYEVGHMIAPRLNAMGRLESAMDSLRLLCTKNIKRAQNLALTLGQTNRERQLLTQASTLRAIEVVKSRGKIKNILIIEDDFEEGIIGLVAGRLVETFYRPSIVISKKDGVSKASARSISGINIIEFIRKHSEFLVNAGGHPMAAGFTIETVKIGVLKKKMEELALIEILEEHLERILNIDLEIPLSIVDLNFYDEIQKLSPFGMSNPEPVFLSKNVKIESINLIGKDRKHVKLKFRIQNSEFRIDGIAFNMVDKFQNIKLGDLIDIVFVIDRNEWNGRESIQLKIKDVKKR